MAYWIFKISEQEIYPDVLGKQYVYDNTHSVRVTPGDTFIYLDKRTDYSFSATGTIGKLTKRTPTLQESKRTSKIRDVFTAHLVDVLWFSKPLSISPLTKIGKSNRATLGIIDVNLLGWSQSMPSLSESMYQAILDLAETENLISFTPQDVADYSVPDSWGKTKTRRAAKRFSTPVIARSDSKCIVCGTSVTGIVEAAHLSPYATDIKNRANPANGICLCKYCHCALDLRLIAIQPSGELLISPTIDDRIAKFHFTQVSGMIRRKWLRGVDAEFLELTVKWFKDNLLNAQ